MFSAESRAQGFDGDRVFFIQITQHLIILEEICHMLRAGFRSKNTKLVKFCSDHAGGNASRMLHRLPADGFLEIHGNSHHFHVGFWEFFPQMAPAGYCEGLPVIG